VTIDPAVFGIASTAFFALAGVAWALLHNRINRQQTEIDRVAERSQTEYQRLADRVNQELDRIEDINERRTDQLFDKLNELKASIASLSIQIAGQIGNYMTREDCARLHGTGQRTPVDGAD